MKSSESYRLSDFPEGPKWSKGPMDSFRRGSKGNPQSSGANQPPRVLVLEDDLSDLEMMTKPLENNNIPFISATDGKKAEKFLKEYNSICVAILDLRIEINGKVVGPQGYDVANYIMELKRPINVIILTSLPMDKLAGWEENILNEIKVRYEIYSKQGFNKNKYIKLVKNCINSAPVLFFENCRREPFSNKEKQKVFSELWLSRDWNKKYREIFESALSIAKLTINSANTLDENGEYAHKPLGGFEIPGRERKEISKEELWQILGARLIVFMVRLSGVRDWEDRLRGSKTERSGGSDPLVQRLLDLGIEMGLLRKLEDIKNPPKGLLFWFEHEILKGRIEEFQV